MNPSTIQSNASHLLHSDITQKIIGCAFEVHKFLGNGFQEVIYQRALEHEFDSAGLNFHREIERKIFYKDLEKPIGIRRADFVVENKVLVELKALTELNDVHLAQALNYLKAYRLEVGLLINFGTKSLEFKRLILSNDYLKKSEESIKSKSAQSKSAQSTKSQSA